MIYPPKNQKRAKTTNSSKTEWVIKRADWFDQFK